MAIPKNPLKVEFIQACVPVLEDGDYKFTVNQVVSGVTKNSDLPSVTKQISVAGPRFTLDPSLIYGQFPPKNSKGNYDSSLPHVVISRKTLPWERTIDGQPVTEPYNPDNPDTVPTPWLALLSFSEDESSKISKVTSVELEQLTSPGSGIFFPSLKLNSFEKKTDQCQVINVDATLFSVVAPKATDLPYLAHARFADNTHKATEKASSDGYYSVVVGNRFPKSSGEGNKNTMYLVSLEGYQEYLPGGSNNLNNYSKVQLVVLSSWSYIDQSDPFDFKTLSENLDISSLALPSTSEQQPKIKDSFEMGYTALNHINRVGEKTISWYRGPFIPQETTNELVDTTFPNSDAALRYDPVSGMFDVSYAAAWQLGQLLAIQNKGFATALYKERIDERRKAIEVHNNSLLEDKVSTINAEITKNDNKTKTNLMISKLKNGLAENILNEIGKKSHGDVSGLNKAIKKVPGILSKQEVKKIVDKSADPESEIANQLQSINKNQSS